MVVVDARPFSLATKSSHSSGNTGSTGSTSLSPSNRGTAPNFKTRNHEASRWKSDELIHNDGIRGDESIVASSSYSPISSQSSAASAASTGTNSWQSSHKEYHDDNDDEQDNVDYYKLSFSLSQLHKNDLNTLF